VVLYLRVSTSEQAVSGLGIEAQRATAQSYAERKGLKIVDEFCDQGISAKSLSGRPGALAALSAVRGRNAAGLLVAKMDRLSRSVVDGAGLMELEPYSLAVLGERLVVGGTFSTVSANPSGGAHIDVISPIKFDLCVCTLQAISSFCSFSTLAYYA